MISAFSRKNKLNVNIVKEYYTSIFLQILLAVMFSLLEDLASDFVSLHDKK